ncbi:MAG: GNAT family N-acetyltransferase [Marinibacterium sp.]
MLRTRRLELRPLEPSDADWIVQGIADPRVHQWLTGPPRPYGREDAEEFLSRHAGKPDVRAILLQGAPVGVVSLMGDPVPDLGYWLCVEHWGQGIMTEAAGALLDWYAGTGGGAVTSGWIRGNAGSENVLRKLGFRPAGRVWQRSEYQDREVEIERVVWEFESRA